MQRQNSETFLHTKAKIVALVVPYDHENLTITVGTSNNRTKNINEQPTSSFSSRNSRYEIQYGGSSWILPSSRQIFPLISNTNFQWQRQSYRNGISASFSGLALRNGLKGILIFLFAFLEPIKPKTLGLIHNHPCFEKWAHAHSCGQSKNS